MGKVTKEQPDRSFLTRLVSFDRIVWVVEKETGRKWAEFGRRGDPGRGLVLYLARMHSGLTLSQIGAKAGGMEYKAVSMAVKRFETKLSNNTTLRSLAKRCQGEVWNVET